MVHLEKFDVSLLVSILKLAGCSEMGCFYDGQDLRSFTSVGGVEQKQQNLYLKA